MGHVRTTLLAAICGAALLASVSAVQAEQCGQKGYVLICRGHYQVEFRDYEGWHLEAKRAPTAAGADGASLPPGSCAWEDRPLNAAEKPEVYMAPPYLDSASALSPQRANYLAWFSVVSQCALNDKCTVELCATGKPDGRLEILRNKIVTRVP